MKIPTKDDPALAEVRRIQEEEHIKRQRERMSKEEVTKKRLLLEEGYKITDAMPFRQKVVSLYDEYSLDPAEIAELLDRTPEDVQAQIDRYEKDITDASRALTPEEKARERGKHVIGLEKLLSRLNTLFDREPDGGLAEKINKIREKLMLIKDLDVRDAPEEEELIPFGSSLEAAIAKLSVEQVAHLREILLT